MSAVEIVSAIERKSREGALSSDGRRRSLRALAELGRAWTEISTIESVRERAVRLLATHSLRTADALQLGAALVAVGDRPAGNQFICCDRRLCDAATREGFDVIQLEEL